jgi:hypothetical protein
MVQRRRSTRFEILESRCLLAVSLLDTYQGPEAPTAEGEADALVRFTYDFVSTNNESLDPNPTDNIQEYRAAIGDIVKLKVYAQDLRTNPTGIASPYHDVQVVPQVASPLEILGLRYGEANVVRVEARLPADSYQGNYKLQYTGGSVSQSTTPLPHPLVDGQLNQADATQVAEAINQLDWGDWQSPDFPVTARPLADQTIDGVRYNVFAVEFTGSNLRRADQPNASLLNNSLQLASGIQLLANVEVVNPNPLDARSVSVAMNYPTSNNHWGDKRLATWNQTAVGFTLANSGGSLSGATVQAPEAKHLIFEASFEVLNVGSLEISGSLSNLLAAPVLLVGNSVPLTADQIEFPSGILFRAVEPGSDPAEPNNSRPSATLLGAVEGDVSVAGLSIHSVTDSDWFQFSTLATGNISHYAAITFNHLAGDLDLELYDQAGNLLDSSKRSQNQEFVSLHGLPAASYFVRVVGFQGNTNLDFELFVNAPVVNIAPDSLEANDSIASSTNLGSVTSGGQLEALSIHSAIDTDCFRFEILSPGRTNHYARIEFVHASGDLELRLYNASGTLLDSSATANDFEAISLAGKNAGVYYLQIKGENGAKNPGYRLIIQPPESVIAPDGFESNDSRETATNFAVTQPYYEFDQLSIHQAGNDDWYSFFLSQTGAAGHYISVAFEHAFGDVDVQLLDRNGLLVRASTTATNEERISLSGLPLGQYYIRAYGNGSARQPNYKLGISVPVLEVDADFYGPNETRFEAFDLRTVNGSFSLDYLTIHSAADEDWFRFETAATANANHFVGLLYRAGDGEVDLELYDQAGVLLARSSMNDNWEQIDFQGRTAAVYYVRIHSVAGKLNSQYSLGFSLPETKIPRDRFEDNATLGTATNLKTLKGTQAFDALSLHSPSDVDWFRFTIAADAAIAHHVELRSSASGDIDIELYDLHGNLLAESRGPAEVERISLAGKPAGEYWLRVSGSAAVNPSYSLLFETPLLTILPDPYESNDFRNTAYDLRGLEGERRVQNGSIHQATDQDWFRFQLLNSGRQGHYVELQFEQREGDLDLGLYDSTGTLLRSSLTAKTTERISLADLVGGTYYVRVSSFAGATNPAYALEFLLPNGSSLPPDRFENNNSLGTATLVRNEAATLHGSLALADLNIHSATDQDYFRFTIVASATAAHGITLDFNPSDGDLDLFLYDSTGSLLRQATQIDSIEHVSLAAMPAGTYTAVVRSKSNASNSYDLAFDTPLLSSEIDAWTILVYMTSSDIEDAAFADINELEAAVLGLPGTVNVAVYWDQSELGTKYATGNGAQTAWGTAGRAVLRPDRDPHKIASSFELLGEQNSGAGATLVDFVQWATSVAPAEKYALITWAHGSGIFGLNQDRRDATTADSLQTAEWLAALRSPSMPHFDLLALDASNMALSEIAYGARQAAELLVASQAALSGDGFNYQEALASLRKEADLSGEQLAAELVQSYESSYAKMANGWNTVAAIRLAEMNSLAAALKQWTSQVGSLNDEQWKVIVQAFAATVGYANPDYRDLGGAFKQLVAASTLPSSLRVAAQDVLLQLERSLLSKSNDRPQSSGLSIFAPTSDAHRALYGAQFAEFMTSTDWDDFIVELASRAGGNPAINERFGRVVSLRDWSEGNDLFASGTNLFLQSGTNLLYPDLSLHQGNDVDWFRFSLGTTATGTHQVRVIKSGLTSVKIDLLDANGQVVLRNHTSSTLPLISLSGLVAGNYSLRISAADGNTLDNYSLVFDAPVSAAVIDRTGSNQVVERSFDLGFVHEGLSLINQPLASLGVEWFTFESPKLSEPSWYSLQVQLAGGLNAEAILRNAAGAVIARSSGTNELLLGYLAPAAGERYQIELFSKTASRSSFSLRISNLKETFADVAVTERLAGGSVDALPLTELVSAVGNVTVSDGRFQWQNNALVLKPDAYLNYATERSLLLRLVVSDLNNAGKSVSILLPIAVLMNSNPWHNQQQIYNTTMDVDSGGAGIVNAIDALAVINALNRNGGSFKLPIFRRLSPTAELQFDVNDDGHVTAIDALMVINYLSSR